MSMGAGPVIAVEYLEPMVEAEALPDEFSPSNLRRALLIVGAIVVGVAALIVLVPGLGSLRDRLAGAQPEWIALAAALQLGSCAGYVLVFRGVFCRRMSWRTSTEIGLSELAANSLLSGVGASALALGARSLATRLARRPMRTRIVAAAEAVGEGVDEAVRLVKQRNPAILVGASAYLLFDVAMLGACFKAFGNDVPPAGVLLVAYLVGQLGSLIPIPGGIGGVDGGLIATLVLYGVDPADAAVAVIAYRGLLLTIPAALGLPALAILRRRLRDEAHDIAACAPGQSVEVLGRGSVRMTFPASSAGS
jgi:uncharacterized membrane protein YbhN (UPF0104 family)